MPFRKKCMKKDVVGPTSQWCRSICSKFGIDPFCGFQLMPFYTDRQTDRQTILRFIYIYIIYVGCILKR